MYPAAWPTHSSTILKKEPANHNLIGITLASSVGNMRLPLLIIRKRDNRVKFSRRGVQSADDRIAVPLATQIVDHSTEQQRPWLPRHNEHQPRLRPRRLQRQDGCDWQRQLMLGTVLAGQQMRRQREAVQFAVALRTKHNTAIAAFCFSQCFSHGARRAYQKTRTTPVNSPSQTVSSTRHIAVTNESSITKKF